MSNIASPAAAAAYASVQQQAAAGAAGPAAAKAGEAGGGFAAMLEDAAKSAVETIGKSEQTAIQAAAGEADLLEVVSSVHDAESTLRTVVAVRDKVVQSYQEILRMPI